MRTVMLFKNFNGIKKSREGDSGLTRSGELGSFCERGLVFGFRPNLHLDIKKPDITGFLYCYLIKQLDPKLLGRLAFSGRL